MFPSSFVADSTLPTVFSWCSCQRLVDCMCMRFLFVDSVLSYWSVYLSLCYIVLITVCDKF